MSEGVEVGCHVVFHHHPPNQHHPYKVMCLGNHEVLNALGLFNYADKEGNEEFERVFGPAIDRVEGNSKWRMAYAGNQPSRWRACEPGGAFSDRQ